MKNYFLLIGLSLILITARAQEKTSFVRQELDNLMKAKPLDTVQVLQKLKSLVQTDDERNWVLASGFYYRLGKTATVDSLQEAERVRFPAGYIARSKAATEIYNQTSAEDAERAYNAWIKQFPMDKFPKENHDRVVYDYVTSAIAGRYAKAGNATKAKEFIAKLQEEFWKGNAYGGLSETFYRNGDLANAEVYSKMAMESAKLFLNATDNAGKFAASGYPGLTRTYAKILYEEKKYDQALQYIDTVYRMNRQVDPATNFTYAELLLHARQGEKAYAILEEVMKTGKATPDIDTLFKKLYLEQKGDSAAYVRYMEGNKKVVAENMRGELAGAIISKPAPGFTLEDLDGKTISLAQFKGKTVVLDFWATWCGPCKRSFPTMQRAIDKYRSDPNVQFLFIHTWERDDKATQAARNFIDAHGYDFEVLMDLKDPKSKQNKVVKSYGVSGIPTKFVIDPEGNIRFQLTGFDGSEEQGLNEISMMIEMAREQR